MKTSNSSAKRLDPEVSIKGFDQAFATTDANRATGYAQLGQVRSAKSASLAREQKLLNIKYGSAATPRAQYAAAALPNNEQFRRELAAAREVLETTPPVVDENSFVVYGFVRRKDQTGIPGLTLALTDQQGTWLRETGYACTDKRGYFELRIERKAGDEKPGDTTTTKTPEELKREAAAAATGKTAETSSTGGIKTNLGSGLRINTNQSTAARTGVQLRVFNREGRVLHIEQRPVVPKAASVDYRLIVLDDEDCGCTPPPEKSDGKTNPSAPSAPAAPPPAPAQPSAGSVAPRVAGLKSYENPPPASANQPLEAIRGIGPKTAGKLRSAGIEDVSEFKKTEGSKLVKLAGFDKVPPKPTASTKPSKDAPKPTARTTSEKKKQPVKKVAAKSKTKRPKK